MNIIDVRIKAHRSTTRVKFSLYIQCAISGMYTYKHNYSNADITKATTSVNIRIRSDFDIEHHMMGKN